MLACHMAHLNCPNGKRKMDVTIDRLCSRVAGLLAEGDQNFHVLSQEQTISMKSLAPKVTIQA